MQHSDGVVSTYPLDNLHVEINRLLGPVWTRDSYSAFLPRYLRPLPSRLDRGDVDFLVKAGAFDIYEPPVCEALLRSYIHHVHPHVPFLDLDWFLSCVVDSEGSSNHNRDSDASISLLLFNAIMFAGALFVDMNGLYAAGFLSRREACASLHRRARALYDLDCEDDALIVIQSLLLMSYWYEDMDTHKDGRYWIGICVSLAQSIRLDCDQVEYLDYHARFQKRLWWCIYTRDRLIALGLQQPPIIDDILRQSMPMVTPGDFDPVHATPRLQYILGSFSNHQISLSRVFIEKSKLCRLVASRILRWREEDASAIDLVILDFELCKQDLSQWETDLPPGIQWYPEHATEVTNGGILHGHRAWLRLVFLELSFTVTRRLQALSRNSLTYSYAERQLLESTLQLTAWKVTDVLDGLNKQNMTDQLPTTAVALICRTCITVLRGMQPQTLCIEATSVRRFRICVSALKNLARLYGSATLLSTIFGRRCAAWECESSADKILSDVDLEALSRLTLQSTWPTIPRVLTIRDPYCIDIVSQLRLQRLRRVC
ncbi:fungal-specific transcription factor domain-containing protein [Aspergillus insuetus]